MMWSGICVGSCYRGCPNGKAVAGKIAFNPYGAAANQSGLSETEVDHLQVGTRGRGHFLARRGNPTKHELHRGVPFLDQYGCGNLEGMDPFFTLLSEHRGRLVTGGNALRCLPLIDEWRKAS